MSPNDDRSGSGLPWFATKGQVAQLLFAILGSIFSGVKAWPEMKQNEYLTAGALLFYTLVGLVIASFVAFIRAVRKQPPSQRPAEGVEARVRQAEAESASSIEAMRLARAESANLKVAILKRLWVSWSSLGDMYERLDYDNRGNNSTRLPFHSGSWPDYDQPWSYVQAQLHKNYALTDALRHETEHMLKALGLNGYALPLVGEPVVMVDFLREVREFQAYLERKLAEERENTGVGPEKF